MTSEKIELPTGTVLDWRFSSFWESPAEYAAATQISERTSGFVLLFDEQGIPITLVNAYLLDRFTRQSNMPANPNLREYGIPELDERTSLLSGSTEFLVRAYRDFDQQVSTADPETREFEISQQVLDQEDSIWVTSSAKTGKVTTAAAVKPTSNDSIRSMLFQSRALTRVK